MSVFLQLRLPSKTHLARVAEDVSLKLWLEEALKPLFYQK
jgi:hypothetical protein